MATNKRSAAMKKYWANRRAAETGRLAPLVEKYRDVVNHPQHYLSHPSGVECITITEHMNFNLGNATKYIWRSGDKGDYVEQLKKAAWYIQREIDRVSK